LPVLTACGWKGTFGCRRWQLFKDFAEYYGKAKFQNKTNGITPRRCVLKRMRHAQLH